MATRGPYPTRPTSTGAGLNRKLPCTFEASTFTHCSGYPTGTRTSVRSTHADTARSLLCTKGQRKWLIGIRRRVCARTLRNVIRSTTFRRGGEGGGAIEESDQIGPRSIGPTFPRARDEDRRRAVHWNHCTGTSRAWGSGSGECRAWPGTFCGLGAAGAIQLARFVGNKPLRGRNKVRVRWGEG